MDLSVNMTEAMQKYIDRFESIGDKGTMRKIGDATAEGIIPYIPQKSGNLAYGYVMFASRDEVVVTWDGVTPYAAYQYYGEIFKNNYATFSGKQHKGFISSRVKEPSGRMIGSYVGPVTIENGSNKGKTFYIEGYTKSRTNTPGPFWTEKARNTPEIWYPIRYNITQELRKAWYNRK